MLYSRHSRSVRSSVLALVVGAALFSGKAALAEAAEIRFDIPAESTAAALNDLASQAKIHLLFPYDVASRTSASAVQGTYSIDEALAKILAGSGLEIADRKDGTISLRAIVDNGEAPTEVIVTGSHIRGGNPTSPVHTVTRADIDASGYAQLGDVMRALPENFSGGQNPGIIAAGETNTNNQNVTGASTVNLRGLGSDATLVLLNGHRLAADSYYQGSDIGGIPMDAVQRIEVVPDGASALYGSDAVAGVVNIILRKRFHGGEVKARVGDTAQGGGAQRFVSLLQGWSGPSGYLLVNAELDHTDPILAGDRAFAAEVPADGHLMAAQKRQSLFVSAGLDFGDRSSLTFDAVVSDRLTEGGYHYAAAAPISDLSTYTPNYSTALTFDTQLGGDWKLRATGVAAGSRNSQTFAYPAYNYSGTAHYANSTQYAEVTADGTLFTLPSGDVKAALGGGYRKEHFAADGEVADRNVTYAYVEALAPLISPSVSRAGLHELELSLSARTERYSDFGSTTNPRVGLRYVPTNSLTLRATWGTSFKAPSFVQMYDPRTIYIYDAALFGYAGTGVGMMTWGGNPDLKPERSTSQTFGIDFSPQQLKSLKLSATWFGIDYKDRVVQPIANYLAGLSDPQYAAFVDWAPSADDQAAVIAAADAVYNYASIAYDPATVVAILRNGYANATSQTVKGMDLSYRQSLNLTKGQVLALFANASWLQVKQETLAGLPEVELSGTIFNVPKFKARGGATWQAGGLSLTTTINYIASESDNGVSPAVNVASWTTVDANLAYDFAGNSGNPGWKVALIASNLFDKAPPRSVSPATYEGLHFDSANASLIGRFVSVTVARSW